MIDFIDETSEREGTAFSRNNMMAVQGFEDSTTIFDSDGSVVEIFGSGASLTTVFNSDGTIIERFEGEKTITKKTTFNKDGSIDVKLI